MFLRHKISAISGKPLFQEARSNLPTQTTMCAKSESVEKGFRCSNLKCTPSLLNEPKL